MPSLTLVIFPALPGQHQMLSSAVDSFFVRTYKIVNLENSEVFISDRFIYLVILSLMLTLTRHFLGLNINSSNQLPNTL